jgi:hypothetical protein
MKLKFFESINGEYSCGDSKLVKNSDIPEVMSSLNKQIISGRVGFHIRDGSHNLSLRDWDCFMNFDDMVLK